MESLLRASTYFMISVILYVILSRIVFGNGILKFVLSGAVVGAGLLTREFALQGLVGLMATALFYAFLCELFIFFISFVRSSVSVSLLLLLKKSPLSQERIDQLYADEAMVGIRIRKLSETSFLIEDSQGRRLTSKGRFLLSVFRALKKFFKHEGVERTLLSS